MKISLERKIFFGFAAAMVVGLGVGAAAWWNARRFTTAFQMVDHTHEVLYRLEKTMTKLLVLQANSRGFALTANESLLAGYDADEAALRETNGELRRLVADNPAQIRRLDQIDPLMTQAIGLLRERIALRRTGGLEAVVQTRPNATGRPVVDLIRELIGDMEGEERRLLLDRSAQSQSAARTTIGVVLFSSGLTTIFIVAAGLFIRRDFGERRGIEQSLQHERDLLGELMDNATEAIYFKDRASRFTRINRELAKRFGLSNTADAVGKWDFDFYTEEHARPAFDDEQEIVRTGRAIAKEEKETWPDGRVTWMLTSKLPLRDASGQIVGIFGLSRDITERKRAEEERDRFFALSLDMLCVANADGYFKRLSPAFTLTLGWSVEEMLHRPFIDFVHPDDRAATLIEVQRQVARGESIMQFENRYHHKDGSWRVLSWKSVPAAGGLMYATARDMTEQRATEEKISNFNAELTRRAGQLEAANHELEAFSYSVSHDLRSPLRHIHGFANLLDKHARATLDEKGQRYVTTIAGAAKQMGQLIDDLLAFSRTGRAQLAPADIAHDALLVEVIRDGHYQADSRTIIWEISPLPSVRADLALLRQVWANLLGNAVKYSAKAAQPRIAIRGETDAAKGENIFSISDNGVGFDMAYAGKLFGVFQRLHGPAEFEGTGIGLANVRRIVARHGGRTWAEGRVGEGATFYFSLPIQLNIEDLAAAPG